MVNKNRNDKNKVISLISFDMSFYIEYQLINTQKYICTYRNIYFEHVAGSLKLIRQAKTQDLPKYLWQSILKAKIYT